MGALDGLAEFVCDEPSLLPAAPEDEADWPAATTARLAELHPCLFCLPPGLPAAVAYVARLDRPRWLDLCTVCAAEMGRP